MADDRLRKDSIDGSEDREDVVIDTTSEEPLRDVKAGEVEREPLTFREPRKTEIPDEQNPPRTTTGKFTAPKFGSAGSGGAELEPGPERD